MQYGNIRGENTGLDRMTHFSGQIHIKLGASIIQDARSLKARESKIKTANRALRIRQYYSTKAPNMMLILLSAAYVNYRTPAGLRGGGRELRGRGARSRGGEVRGRAQGELLEVRQLKTRPDESGAAARAYD